MCVKNQPTKSTHNQIIRELKLLKNLENHRIKGNIVKIENWGDLWVNFINKREERSNMKPLLIYDYHLKLIEDFANKEVARFNNKRRKWRFKSSKMKMWFQDEQFSWNKHTFQNWLVNWYNLYVIRTEQNLSQLQTLFLISDENQSKIVTYLQNKPNKNVLNKLFFYVYTCNIINTRLNLLYNYIFKKYTQFFIKYAKKNNLNLILLTLRIYNTSKLINLKPLNFFYFLKNFADLEKNLINTNTTYNFEGKDNLEYLPYILPGLKFDKTFSNLIILDMNKWLEKIFYYRLFFTLQSKFFQNLYKSELDRNGQNLEKNNRFIFLKTLYQLTKRWQNISWLLTILKNKYKYFYIKTKFIK